MRKLIATGLSDSSPKAGVAFRNVIGWGLVDSALIERGLLAQS